MTWHFDLATHIGGRTEQQDRVEVLTRPGRADEHLVILADGVGGQPQGASAAQTAIDIARHAFPHMGDTDPRQFLTDFCLEAHAAIRRIGQENDTNPACTCAVLFLKGDEAYWVHAGDSRLYHFESHRLLSRTHDHTVAQLLSDGADGVSKVHRAGSADNRLYMCLGGHNELEPEFGASAVGDDDWFVLCSDGFWSQVTEDEVAQAKTAPSSGKASASDLASMATERGGPGGDNVSLALVMPRSGTSDVKKAWWRF
ncbi:MAG: PP2C family serine/threonine-protein phosphatase [Sedimenticolaceae bacterium]